MIETYAFLAVFVLQILLMSVLFPSRLIRYTRLQVPRIPADRWAQLFPGVDVEQSVRQFATRFRLTTGLAAVLGLVLFGWFYQYMQAPDWEHGKVMGLVLAYFFLVQVMTLLIEVALGFGSYLKVLRHPSPAGRRSASLQRRDLFHFVSPFAVFLAGLAYVLFAAFMIYLWQRGMELKPVISWMAAITLVYLLDACTIYVLLYRSRVLNPLETNENRGPWIRLQIKGTVYSCIFIVAFVAVSATLDMLHLKQWHPFAVSVFLVGCTLTFFTSLAAAPRYPETPELSAGAGR